MQREVEYDLETPEPLTALAAASTGLDRWAEWQLYHRYGGDPDQLQAYMDFLYPVRDRVLDGANLPPGGTLLDVGTGDGLIGFGGLERVGPEGRVIFNDISQDLLDHVYEIAQETGALGRCAFLNADATNLTALESRSVDAVTTRSVLVYISAKHRAFRQFYRVLKPGGRVSIFEPIQSFTYPEPAQVFRGYNVRPIIDVAHKLHEYYAQHLPEEDDPMLDFDERDLLYFAERAGFKEVHLDLQIDIHAKAPTRWETFLCIASAPHVPPVEQAMQEVLTPAEREHFTLHLRPLVEAGRGMMRTAVAYLWAVKPTA